MYKIVGSDQRIYGPVNVEQIRIWLAEGRVTFFTLAQPEAGGDWKPLSAWPEFAAPPAPPPLAMPPRPAVAETGSGLAVVGLTLGLLSNVCCVFGLLLGAAGVICSSIALTQSNTHPRHANRGLAIAGLALSIFGLLWHSFFRLFFGLLFPLGLLRHHGVWHFF